MAQWKSQVSLIFDKAAPVVEFFFDTGYPSGSTGLISGRSSPFSRGSIRATSQNPYDAARIDPNYFGLSIDMDMQVQCLRAGRRVLQDNNLRSLTTTGRAETTIPASASSQTEPTRGGTAVEGLDPRYHPGRRQRVRGRKPPVGHGNKDGRQGRRRCGGREL